MPAQWRRCCCKLLRSKVLLTQHTSWWGQVTLSLSVMDLTVKLERNSATEKGWRHWGHFLCSLAAACLMARREKVWPHGKLTGSRNGSWEMESIKSISAAPSYWKSHKAFASWWNVPHDEQSGRTCFLMVVVVAYSSFTNISWSPSSSLLELMTMVDPSSW